MTGIIVTGHGSFATGITSGLELLAGTPKDYQAVDFRPEDSIESLKEKLLKAVKGLSGCQEILVLADLAGGSPFNVSVQLKLQDAGCNMEVIGGINLPCVLQAYMTRAMETDVSTLAEEVMEAAKGAIIHFEASDGDEEEYEE